MLARVTIRLMVDSSTSMLCKAGIGLQQAAVKMEDRRIPSIVTHRVIAFVHSHELWGVRLHLGILDPDKIALCVLLIVRI